MYVIKSVLNIFHLNQVFADDESSLNPISVPRSWIWNLKRRTVYFGTSVPTIFKGKDIKFIQIKQAIIMSNNEVEYMIFVNQVYQHKKFNNAFGEVRFSSHNVILLCIIEYSISACFYCCDQHN